MDMPKVNDVLRVFRDYSSLVVPAVLIGVAVIILLVTPVLMGGNLEDKVNRNSLTLARNARSLGQKAVSSEQWKEAEKYLEAQKVDANKIGQLARQTTQRELLSYKLFPEPKDKSLGIYHEFGQRYCNSIDTLLETLNATECPTEEEIQSIRDSSSGGSRSFGSSMPFDTTRSSNVDIMIRDVICAERAKSASVYAQRSDFPGYQYWISDESVREGDRFEYTGMKESVAACWYWQLGYWIIEDVAATVSALNSGSNSVYTSPVKRLVRVSFLQKGAASINKDRNRPEYVILKDGERPQVLTSRTSKDDTDVVHFVVSVVVSNKAVLAFMRELSAGKEHRFRGYFGDEPEQVFRHNQITILDSGVIAVDRDGSEHSLYRYGDDASVELELICEYVFNRSGYDQIKPESVKEQLGIGAPVTTIE